MIENGVNGLLVPVNNVDRMAEAMGSILSDGELVDSLGHEAAQIIKKLEPSKIYRQWEMFIYGIVNHKI